MKLFLRGLTYVALGIAALLALIPIWWLVMATLRPSDQVFSEVFSASHPTMDNYRELMKVENPSFLRSLMNSLFIACAGVTVLAVIVGDQDGGRRVVDNRPE